MLKRIFAIFTGVMCLLTMSVGAMAADVSNTTSENNSLVTDVSYKGAISTNTGKYASASGHGTMGVVDGQVTSIQAQRGKTTKASLTGVMVSSKGLSFTLPGVSSSIYRK